MEDKILDEMKDERVIIHIDLDCYYAQVEMKRNNHPKDKPFAVQQWTFLVAVNYPAKNAGVIRGQTTVEEAKKICPDIKLVHVDTISALTGETYKTNNPNRQTDKPSLKIFREESIKIFKIFKSYSPQLEKGGIDEAYLDVTSIVNQQYLEIIKDTDHPHFFNRDNWKSDLNGEKFAPLTESDRKLMLGSHIAYNIRREIYEKLDYTCSAGIAHNKMLAKLASATNKPNGQTTIPFQHRELLIQQTNIKKIRFCGGKVGNIAESKGFVKMNELKDKTLSDLETIFEDDEVAKKMYLRVRGVDHEPVKDRGAPKSLTSIKTINQVETFSSLENVIKVICLEMKERITEMYQEYTIYPDRLHLYYPYNKGKQAPLKTLPMLGMEYLETEGGFQAFYSQIRNEYFELRQHILPARSLSIGVSGMKPVKRNCLLDSFINKEIEEKAVMEEGITKKRKKIINLVRVPEELKRMKMSERLEKENNKITTYYTPTHL